MISSPEAVVYVYVNVTSISSFATTGLLASSVNVTLYVALSPSVTAVFTPTNFTFTLSFVSGSFGTYGFVSSVIVVTTAVLSTVTFSNCA